MIRIVYHDLPRYVKSSELEYFCDEKITARNVSSELNVALTRGKPYQSFIHCGYPCGYPIAG
jgi:hypothetical protein